MRTTSFFLTGLLALAIPPAAASPPLPRSFISTETPGHGREEAPGRRPHAFTFDDMVRLGKVSDPRLSPDGTRLAFVRATADPESNKTGSAIFMCPSGGGRHCQGEGRQLTFPPAGQKYEAKADVGNSRRAASSESDVRDSAPRFSPDGQRLAFVSTRDGTPQIYLLDLSGGEARRLTNLPGGASDPVWLPDGKGLIVQSSVFPECPPLSASQGEACNRRRGEAVEQGPIKARVIERLFYRHWDSWYDGRRTHLIRVAVDAPGGGRPGGAGAVKDLGPVDLTPTDLDTPPVARAGAEPYAISPDGRELALVQNRDRQPALSTNHDIYVMPLGTQPGAMRNLTEDSPGTDVAPRYSPDGRYLAYLSQRRPGFEADRVVLWVYDRQSRQRRPLTESLDANAAEPAWSPDSGRIYFATSLLGRGRIYSVDLSGKPPVEVAAYEAADLQVAAGAGPGDGPVLYFLGSSLSRAPEVYRLPLTRDGRAAGPAVAVTDVNGAAFAGVQLGKVSELWARTGDGQRLHSFLLTPPAFDPGRRYPAVVLIHGGPQGAWEDSWHWRWNPQIYAGAGYVVLMVNPRGSEGFGQRFVDEVSGDWGGKAYDDVMRAVDQLVAQPYVDARRVAALGASYGGYMVNWIAGHTDRFAALVSHDGVYDIPSMHGETEELWFPRWEFKGDPWDSEQYQKWNPARFAGKFKTPMLVITSEKDYRVPVGQGMQLFTALQLRGVPSKMLIFPDENHWVLKPGNSRLWHANVLDWLHRYLGGAPADKRALQTAGCHAQ